MGTSKPILNGGAILWLRSNPIVRREFDGWLEGPSLQWNEWQGHDRYMSFIALATGDDMKVTVLSKSGQLTAAGTRIHTD